MGTTGYSYDDARRLVGIDRKSAASTSAGTYSYAYDATSQLADDSGTGFTYDATGNRTNTGCATTAGNRLDTDGVWTYTDDDAGAVTGKSKSGEA